MREGVRHKCVVESDEPYAGQMMAIGIVPQERTKVRKLLSNLPLVR